MSKLFLLIGLIGICLFHLGVSVPIGVSAATLIFVTIHIIRLYKQSRIGPLTVLLFAVYAMPFIHVFPYLWFDFGGDSPLFMWGLLANPYMTNKPIIELMSLIGAVGAVGFAAGASVSRGTLPVAAEEMRPFTGKTFPLPMFFVWVGMAIVLTWISAPAETVFTVVYTESASPARNWNFASSWLFSYAFVAFVLADAIFEPSPGLARIKRWTVLLAMLVIVVWFQFLRGDRESLPLVPAALLMYYAWGKGARRRSRSAARVSWPVIGLLLALVFVANIVVGTLRSYLTAVRSLSDLQSIVSDLWAGGAFRVDNMLGGTWSAVLLTPLSIAGDYIHGTLSLHYGQTYVDLVGSIIPGFVADWIGYARPIDAFNGPTTEMIYGLGGTHATVVPFLNFRMAGVFIILSAISFLVARVERLSVTRLTPSRLALLGILATAIPHWLWYGDKNIVNALIMWGMLTVLYRLRLSTRSAPSLSASYRPIGSAPVTSMPSGR